VKDPYAIAGVIKKIFDKMPMPLIPTWFYDFAVRERRGKISVEEFRERMEQLPAVNYKTLVFITGFLTRVALFQKDSKMTSYNLAVVFAPSFLRPEVYNLNDYIKE
jgi:Rho GTPase-activating protein 1